MDTADMQVIDMVNARYERRARKQEELLARKAKRAAQKKRSAAVAAFLWLIVKLECYMIVAALMFLATVLGWVAADLGIIGVYVCIAGGFVELWRHERRRQDGVSKNPRSGGRKGDFEAH